jgi:PIN domain nuclease of toxin-antitoxin system
MQLGKLELERDLAEVIHDQRKVNGLRVLPVQLKHVLALQGMPLHHRDPFDRLLVAQAKVERALLLSRDALLKQYEIEIRW